MAQPGHSLYGAAARPIPSTQPALQHARQQGQGPASLCGGTIVFGGGVPLYKGKTRVGGLGASGDTACADHEIAKRMRDKAGLNPPGGALADDIWFSKADGPSIFAHPLCKNTWRNGKKIGEEQPRRRYCMRRRHIGVLALALARSWRRRRWQGVRRNSGLTACASAPIRTTCRSRATRGRIDNAVARLVADALGAELEYTWLPQRRGFVRNTLKAGHCDVMMEAPTGLRARYHHIPYYRSGYVFLVAARSPPGSPLVRRSASEKPTDQAPDDWRRLRQFAARGGAGEARPGRATSSASPSMATTPADPPVAHRRRRRRRRIDVAVVWGPLGGWYAKESSVPLSITPIFPAIDRTGLPLTFAVSMAVRRGDTDLRHRLDEIMTVAPFLD